MLYNLKEIHRPETLEEAMRLLSRKDVTSKAVAGGTAFVGEGGPDIEAAVYLDRLGLDKIERTGNSLTLGATVRLQTLVEDVNLGDVAGGLLSHSARRMAGWHIRNAATVGGSVLSAPSSAPLLLMLAALDAEAHYFTNQTHSAPLLDFLNEWPETFILTALQCAIPGDGVGFGYADVGRTPADNPIVNALARVGDSKAGIWLGGLGTQVVTLPADEAGLDEAIAALPEPPSNFLGSAEYRRAMAGVLTRRALAQANG